MNNCVELFEYFKESNCINNIFKIKDIHFVIIVYKINNCLYILTHEYIYFYNFEKQ